MSTNVFPDGMGADLLHHVPGLDSVRGALKILGWVMRRRDRIYLEVRPAFTQHTRNFDFYLDVGFWLVPSRLRLTRWIGPTPDDTPPSDLEDIEQSIHARIVDLLKARDGVAFNWLRHQNNATLDDMLYHLRAAIPTSTALFDSLATFACIAFEVDVEDLGGVGRVSLGKRDFRKALRNAGALGFADQVAGCGPLWHMLWALRNPIVHGGGLSGVGYQEMGGAAESRLTLRGDQAEKVVAVAQWAGHDAESWGLHDTGYEPLLEPLRFVEQFSAAVFRTASNLVIALADDLNAPSLEYVTQPDEVQRLRKFSLISGMESELLASGAPLRVNEPDH